MSECSKIKSLVSLAAGDDLPADETGRVRRHLAVCPSCRAEESVVSELVLAARSAGRADFQLPDSVRQRIALEAAGSAVRGRSVSWLPVRVLLMPRYRLMTAAAACLVALLVPLALRHQAQLSSRADGVTRIEVVADQGVVRLAWSDGQKASYTVLKTSDPRNVSAGETHVVRGNVWVDRQPDSSPVVFYRVE